jgi:hypothetical protein
MYNTVDFSYALDRLASATGYNRLALEDLELAVNGLNPPSRRVIIDFVVNLSNKIGQPGVDNDKVAVMLSTGVNHVIDELDNKVQGALRKAMSVLDQTR